MARQAESSISSARCTRAVGQPSRREPHCGTASQPRAIIPERVIEQGHCSAGLVWQQKWLVTVRFLPSGFYHGNPASHEGRPSASCIDPLFPSCGRICLMDSKSAMWAIDVSCCGQLPRRVCLESTPARHKRGRRAELGNCDLASTCPCAGFAQAPAALQYRTATPRYCAHIRRSLLPDSSAQSARRARCGLPPQPTLGTLSTGAALCDTQG